MKIVIASSYGHAAVVKGGYYGRKSKANLRIFQAGGMNEKTHKHMFGHMSLKKGFGKIRGVKFYVWRKR